MGNGKGSQGNFIGTRSGPDLKGDWEKGRGQGFK
jgi:hypothetical protein